MNIHLAHNPQGSIWHRWEPHIHTPGTILNDQFTGENPWDDFFSRIEQSNPTIRALGITDYYSIKNYSKILLEKNNGRLSNVDLIFANIEIRFDIGTAKGSAINGHLLVSPEDANHISEAIRFLKSLTYSVGGENYRCEESDLIRLGRQHDKNATSDVRALEVGTNQFKVNYQILEKAFKDSAWARKNILFAVCVNTGDGTSGLSTDASFSSLRQHIESMAHIIFGGSPNQRNFWLGKGADSIQQLVDKYKGPKPCIHGSDAHKNDAVGIPSNDRYTWIKGDLTFESLRQICIEPDDRVMVGSFPPEEQIPSSIIEEIDIKNADWITPSPIPLNSGLVAIIGARGSGKTALADMIAVGGTAISTQLSESSFIKRAQYYLGSVSSHLKWQSGEQTYQNISQIEIEELIDTPRVQYLSQQFVDRLCSSEGITDELMEEIERIIFVSHSPEARIGINNFQELLSIQCAIPRTERDNQKDIIHNCSQKITTERLKKQNLPQLQKKYEEKLAAINIDKKNRQGLVTNGNTERVENFQLVSSALDLVSGKLDLLKRKSQSLFSLQQAVAGARNSSFPNFLNKFIGDYKDANLTPAQWESFAIDFKGDVTSLLNEEIRATTETIATIKGVPVAELYNKETSLIPDGAILKDQSFELLTQEVNRLKYLIGVDSQKGNQFARLSEKIVRDEAELLKIEKEIKDAEGADSRLTNLRQKRKEAYNKLFKAIAEEEKTLENLYLPLKDSLRRFTGSLSKLQFNVKRTANSEGWAEAGEGHLDLRKNGPFKGRGTLLNLANEKLNSVWETGTADEISEAVASFISSHDRELLEHLPVDRSDHAAFANWFNQISAWLYSTDHISVNYSIKYDGVDIRQLSPGTRGIVLLLLYLAIDKEDIRPLIIDQPEENLDPKSIFDELVPLFREVKARRQIIIVTHNANLVVNTDADQVIVANCGPHRANQLPQITYKCGSLENPVIREHVCSILEGGEAAFKERAKRLRVKVDN
jgi:ABC-type multidrug transport system ATPase subunit